MRMLSSLSSASSIFSFSRSRHHRDLHSFPTRRSSDLARAPAHFAARLRLAARRAGARPRSLHTNLPHIRHRDLRSEEHTSELQSRGHLVCRLLLEKKKKTNTTRL